MLTYDDLDNMRAGKEAKVQSRSSEIAAQKLEEIAQVEEQQAQQLDQQSADADAEKIINELHNNPDLDPDEVIGGLPPVLQEAVMRKIHDGSVPPPSDEPEMESEMESEMVGDEAEAVDNPAEEAMEDDNMVEDSLIPRKL